MLEGRLLNKTKAIKIWKLFSDAVGIDCIRDNYGSHWPREPIDSEILFGWYDGDILVGWSAIRHDPVDPVMWHISGVFPEYQDKEYGIELFNLGVKKAFDIFPDVVWVFFAISKSNQKFIDHHNRIVKAGNLKRVGKINVPPPGYTIFGLEKSKWEDQDVEKISQSDIS